MYKPKIYLKMLFMTILFVSSALAYSPQFLDKDEEIKLRWGKRTIPISISNSLLANSTNIKAKSEVLLAVKKSLKHWEDVANIEFKYKFTNRENVSEKGSAGDGVSLITIAQTSENLLLFDDKIDNTSAITRLFYNAKGEIKEADIVLNPILLFTTDGTFGSFDLESTLTHEIGHFLGLGHSKVFGATMHNHQGRNGIYNLSGINSRTLSDDDKAGAISLYGSHIDDVECCGIIKGKLNVVDNTSDSRLHIWAEDLNTGKVVAGILTNTKGEFFLEGIPNSTYKLYAQDVNNLFATIYLGEVDLGKEKNHNLNQNISFDSIGFDVQYIVLNGQLSSLALPIKSGKTHTIYIGGKNLDNQKFEILFNSNKINIVQNSILKHDYGNEISVISFDIQVDDNIQIGEYSFYLKSDDSKLQNLVGAITIEPEIK